MAANPSIQLGTDGNWAIKEDNLLAYKKDGTRFFNKEFDFTRGSLATFVDKDGLIKVSGVTDTELVVNGDFATSLSGWSNSNNHWQWTSQGAYFPLISTHNPLTQILTNPVGVKLKITFTLNIVQGTAQIYYNNINNSTVSTQYTQSGTYTLITEPVKQNTDISFSRYGGINTEFYLNNVLAFEIQLDVPRIDFTDDATGHLLLEPQRTNKLPHSEYINTTTFDQTANLTIENNYAISPEGLSNAAKITPDATNGYHQLRTSLATINGTDIISAFVKADGYNYAQLASWATGSNYVNFDLSNGSVSAVGSIAPSVYGIDDYGNGWYRIYANVLASGGGVVGIGVITSATAEWAQSFVGNGTDGILIYGCQIEEGSYPTSYIPTYGSAATRNREVCDNSGSAQDFNSEEGVLYVDIAFLNDTGNYLQISINNGDYNNRVAFENRPVSNQIKAFVVVNGTSVMSSTQTLTDTKSFNKMALKWKQDDFSWWVNGVEIFTDSSGNTPVGLNRVSFDNGTGAQNLVGKTKNVQVFKRAMSNGELYLLTVTQYQSYQEMATALNYTL